MIVYVIITLTFNFPSDLDIIVQLSTLGIVPFFVENVNLLQLGALRLVRAVRLRMSVFNILPIVRTQLCTMCFLHTFLVNS